MTSINRLGMNGLKAVEKVLGIPMDEKLDITQQ